MIIPMCIMPLSLQMFSPNNSFITTQVPSFSVTAVANYCKPGGLQQQKFILS